MRSSLTTAKLCPSETLQGLFHFLRSASLTISTKIRALPLNKLRRFLEINFFQSGHIITVGLLNYM